MTALLVLALALAAQMGPTAKTVAPDSPAALQEWARIVDEMQRDGRLKIEKVERDPQITGRAHQTLAQYHRGVPVFGASVRRQQQGSEVVSLFGTLYTDIAATISITPTLSKDRARAAIARESGADVRSVQPPELAILPTSSGDYVLAYRAEARTSSGPFVFFVDAADGRIILRYRNLQSRLILNSHKSP